LAQGERTLDQMQDAEVADLPQVCCRCAVFADLLGVQKWQWYLATVEQLACAYAKDKEALKGHLDTLKKNFEAAPACEKTLTITSEVLNKVSKISLLSINRAQKWIL
jgi:hypothetical protein